MPDIFVAPEEKLSENLHKRIPFGNPNLDQISSVNRTILKETSNLQPELKNLNKEVTSPKVMAGESKNKFTSPEEADHNLSTPLLTSYWLNPKGIYFGTQEPNENIILYLRKHFITNSTWVFGLLILILLPILAMIIIINFKLNIILNFKFNHAFLMVYYLFVLNYAFVKFLHWFYNISLITKERILDINFENLVYKKFAATKVPLIQDVNYKQTGALRSLFDFGDVLIQTAGTEDNFLLHAVPHPENVVEIVENLIGRKKGVESEL